MDLHKLTDEAIQDAIDYNKGLDGTMTADQEYWFYTGYQFGVEKHHKKDVDRACEWLDRYMVNEVCAGNHSRQYADSFMEKFKQAMEE